MYAINNIQDTMTKPTKNQIGSDQAIRFGAMIRQRRKALKISQDDLALATGVARQFIIYLEAGKPSSQLGLALVVANAVGLRIFDVLEQDATNNALLPDMLDDDLDLPP